MAIIRGRINLPKFIPKEHIVNGPFPFAKCEKTGDWFDLKTGEPVVIMTLEELIEHTGADKCTCNVCKKN